MCIVQVVTDPSSENHPRFFDPFDPSSDSPTTLLSNHASELWQAYLTPGVTQRAGLVPS